MKAMTSRIFFAYILLIVCGIGQSFAAEVYSASATLQTLQTHGYRPHLHTSGQPSGQPVWQVLARTQVDVRAGDVWHVLADTHLRYHQADRLSYSLRVLVCPSACPTGEVTPDAVAVIGSTVVQIGPNGRYIHLPRAGHWRAGIDVVGATVELQVRLLSLPIGSRQGAKVFFHPPAQLLSVVVLP